ncbi:MFS transporter [Arthrobacter ginkgonis]|uniref:MFS transporter n=1 Tax=Arthrobacter ginkgonis TaxID=1630594 RepID=A0ABP7DC15_9MICC
MLAVTSVTVVLVFLNSSSLNVALPALSRDLDASPTQSSWFLLSYMLVTTALILVFGRLADLFGRRRLYIGGIVVFAVGTLACGLAPTADLMIAFRFVQGIGAASVITNNTAILTDTFPPRLLSTGLGINATAAAVGQVLGPVAGGVVVELMGWRWIFLLGVPLLVAGLAASLKLIPRSDVGARTEKLDLFGALLVTSGLATLVVAVNELPGSGGWTNPWILGAGLAALMLIALFVLVQRRRTDPLVDLGIFADRSVAYLYAAGFLSAFATYAVVLLASLYLQSGHGLTALHAGLMVVPAPIGTTLAALVAGRLTNRIHHGLLSAAGCVLIAAGAATVGGSIWLGTSIWPAGATPGLAAGLFVVGFGTGLFMTPNTSALMLTVAPERRGIANAVRSTLQNAGYLFSTSVSLGLATVLLGDADRSLAYAGTLSTSGGDVRAFVGGLMVALAVLVAAAALGALASLRTRRFAAAPSPAPAAEEARAQ